MLLDLLSTSNYVIFNIELAHILSLEASIYISELLNINSKAIKKSKIQDGFMTIDRKYLEQRTTFNEKKQLEIEEQLIKCGIITKNSDDENTLLLDVSVIAALVSSDNSQIKNDIAKVIKKKANTRTKAEVIISQLKENIVTNNEELRKAYYDWIESVYAKQGWMSKKAVVSGQSAVDSFANHNLDVALKVIEIASINGYRDMSWAINTYKDNYKVGYKIPNAPVPKKNTGINPEVVF